jgi:hypothetical protein
MAGATLPLLSRALPMAPGCALDEHDLRAQVERYRMAGKGASLVARTRRRLTVELDQGVDEKLLGELLATERECCPFFALSWRPETRRLTFAVSDAWDEPALDGIALALEIDDRRDRR